MEGQQTKHCNEHISHIQSICQVSKERANELWEASSNCLERAIDIHFASGAFVSTTEEQDRRPQQKAPSLSTGQDHPRIQTPKMNQPIKSKKRQSSPQQRKITDLFSTNGASVKKKKYSPSQYRIDSYFGKQSTSTTSDNVGHNIKSSPVKLEVDDPFLQETSDHVQMDDTKSAKEASGGATFENDSDPKDESLKSSLKPNKTEPTKQISADYADQPKEPTHFENSSQTSNIELKQQSQDSNKQVSNGALVTIVGSGENTKKNASDFPYATLADALAEMASTTKRTIKLQTLQTLFQTVIEELGGIHNTCCRNTDGQTLTCVLDLILGKLSVLTLNKNTITTIPPLQVSGAAVSTAIQTVTGASRQQLRQAYRKSGDLGDAAASVGGNTKQLKAYFVPNFVPSKTERPASGSELTVANVHEMLQMIATVEAGKGSQANRQNLLVQLLRKAQSNKNSLRFLVRTLIGNMRLGATIKTILASLATATLQQSQKEHVDSDEGISKQIANDAIQLLQDTYNICPRIPELATALLQGGVDYAAKHCSIAVGFPVLPMLANPAHSLEEVREFVMHENNQDETTEESLTAGAVMEWKYDGVRCQAHFWTDESSRQHVVKLFSRHLLENTEQYPDVVQYLLQAKDETVNSFIVDSEIVAVSQHTSECDGQTTTFRLLPFQELSLRRGVKKQQQEQQKSSSSMNNTVVTTQNKSHEQKIQVRLYCFDLMYLNGESLLKHSLCKRQALLRQYFHETEGFGFARSVEFPLRYDEGLVRKTLKDAIDDGAEGLMIKLTGRQIESSKCTSTKTFGYESGTRSKNWLKLKRDYVAGYADTIDVVPIGAWLGTGRKAQNGFLSPVLFAVYDEDDGVFRSVSRCMSFSDDMYIAMREFYFYGTPYPPHVGMGDGNDDTAILKQESKATSENGCNPNDDELVSGEEDNVTENYDVNYKEESKAEKKVNCSTDRPSSMQIVTNESPTIWFKPLEVFEVSFADLTLSRAHTAAAGIVDDPQGRGVALRFPRFKRRRPDKSIEEATTTVQIAQLFNQQSKMYQ